LSETRQMIEQRKRESDRLERERLERLRLERERGIVVKVDKKPSTVPDITAQELDRREADLRRQEQVKAKLKTPQQQAREKAIKASKTPTFEQPTPGKRTIINLTETADKLYQEAGFTQKTGLGQTPVKPTIKQLKARLGLAIIEPIIGGVEEATFGIPGAIQSQQRPGTSIYRFAGGISITTPADVVVGMTLRKIGVSKVGKDLLSKIKFALKEIDDPLYGATEPVITKEIKALLEKIRKTGLLPDTETPYNEAIQQLRKIDPNPTSAKEIAENINKYRDAQTGIAVKWKNQKFLDQYAAEDAKFFNNLIQKFREQVRIGQVDDILLANMQEDALTQARRYTAKAAKKRGIPYVDVLDVKNAHTRKYIKSKAEHDLQSLIALFRKDPETTAKALNFIEETQKIPTTAGASYITPEMELILDAAYPWDVSVDELLVFMGERPDLFTDGAVVLSLAGGLSVKDAEKLLEETTSLSKSDIDNVIEQLRKPAPRQEMGEKSVTVQIPEEEQVPTEETIQDQTPEQTPTPKQKTSQDTAQELAQEVPQETVLEPITEEALEPTPIIPFKLKTEKRKKLNLKLFNGPKIKYRVTLRYLDKSNQIRTVEARSHPEAIAKAEMGKNRSKTLKTVESERIQ